jgi:P-type Ca2+ transporter type 2C
VFSVGLLSNRALLVGVGAAIVLQVLAVQTAFGHAIFDTVALGLGDWLLIVGVTASIWAIDELLKLVGFYALFGNRRRPA